jgi:hypothetical protein
MRGSQDYSFLGTAGWKAPRRQHFREQDLARRNCHREPSVDLS